MQKDSLAKFQELKEKILLEYQKQYPFSQGNWASFTSQDIRNLIDLIEKNQKQTVSEKWIYTHLKPEINSKLPRKDMLDIFSFFVGYSGWDEFIFNKEKEDTQSESKVQIKKITKKNILFAILVLLALLIGLFYIFPFKDKKSVNTLEIKNIYTQEGVKEEDIKVYKEEGDKKEPLVVINSEVQIDHVGDEETKIIIESPYYHKKTIMVKPEGKEEIKKTKVELTPDDYAMMLKAFINSDIKDWQIRKQQLDKILSEDLEVMVMLKNNLGAEYFNKKEFSEKLILPVESVRKMKIIEIQNDENNQINFIRIKQE